MYFKEKPNLRSIFPQMTKLIKVLLTIPATSCNNVSRQAKAVEKLFKAKHEARKVK